MFAFPWAVVTAGASGCATGPASGTLRLLTLMILMPTISSFCNTRHTPYCVQKKTHRRLWHRVTSAVQPAGVGHKRAGGVQLLLVHHLLPLQRSVLVQIGMARAGGLRSDWLGSPPSAMGPDHDTLFPLCLEIFLLERVERGRVEGRMSHRQEERQLGCSSEALQPPGFEPGTRSWSSQ